MGQKGRQREVNPTFYTWGFEGIQDSKEEIIQRGGRVRNEIFNASISCSTALRRSVEKPPGRSSEAYDQ